MPVLRFRLRWITTEAVTPAQISRYQPGQFYRRRTVCAVRGFTRIPSPDWVSTDATQSTDPRSPAASTTRSCAGTIARRFFTVRRTIRPSRRSSVHAGRCLVLCARSRSRRMPTASSWRRSLTPRRSRSSAASPNRGSEPSPVPSEHPASRSREEESPDRWRSWSVAWPTNSVLRWGCSSRGDAIATLCVLEPRLRGVRLPAPWPCWRPWRRAWGVPRQPSASY